MQLLSCVRPDGRRRAIPVPLYSGLVLLMLLASTVLSAQSRPVQVQIIVPQPVPTTAPQLLGQSGQSVLMLLNTDPNETYAVRLAGSLAGDNGIKASIDPSQKRPSAEIKLPPLQPVMLTGDDLLNAFANYSPTDVAYDGIALQDLILNPNFPEGNYVICVQVFDYETGQPLSQDPPLNCTPPIALRTPEPPIIQQPLADEQLVLDAFTPVVFTWTPVVLPTGLGNYDIALAEVPKGVNPYDAIETPDLIFYESTGLVAPFFLYDQTLPVLPEGTYVARVRGYDALGQTAVRNDGFSDVVVFHLKRNLLAAPLIDQPQAGDSIPLDQSLVVNWRLPDYYPNPHSFEVTLSEVTNARKIGGQKRFPLTQQTVTKTSVALNLTPLKLDPTKSYELTVQALALDGSEPFANAGLSERIPLVMKSDSPPPPQGSPTNAPYDGMCGSGCEVAAPIDQQAVTGWEPGTTVSMGNATFVLGEITNTGDAYSGEARLATSDFFTLPLKLRLQDVRFNAAGQAIAGSAAAMHDLVAGMPSSWTAGTSEPTMPADAEALYHELRTQRPDGFFDAPPPSSGGSSQVRVPQAGNPRNGIPPTSTKVPTTQTPRATTVPTRTNTTLTNPGALTALLAGGAKLPQRFGEVYLTSLRFTPEGASATLVSIQQLVGSFGSSHDYPVFGAGAVCFTGAGPAVRGDAAALPLLADYRFDEAANQQLVLQRELPGAPYGGTVLRYDCSARQSLRASGYVRFDATDLTEGRYWYGQFTETISSWSDWITVLRNAGSRRPTQYPSAAPATARWELDQLPGYELLAEEVVYDHSNRRNPAGVSFPEGAAAAASFSINGRLLNTLWTGIYAQRATLLMPSYVTTTVTTATEVADEARVRGELNNLVWDSEGLSLQATDRPRGPQANRFIGEWAFEDRGYTVDVRGSVLETADWDGRLRIPLLAEPIDVTLQMQWLGYYARTTAAVEPLASTYSVPAWSAQFRVDPSSRLVASPSNGKLHLRAQLNGQLDFDSEIGNINGVDLMDLRVRGLRLYNYRERNGRAHPLIRGGSFAPPSLARVAHYPVSIRTVRLTDHPAADMDPRHAKLSISYGLELDGLLGGLAAESALELIAKPSDANNSQLVAGWHSLRSIGLERTDFNGAGFRGSLTFGQRNPNEAYFFHGELSGSILGMGAAFEGTFGALPNGKFFQLAATVDSPVPIPVLGPIGAVSAGGGMYYNMPKRIERRPGEMDRPTFSIPSVRNPVDNFGIHLNAVLVTMDGGYLLNGRFGIEVDLRNGSLSAVSVRGAANFLDDNVTPAYWLTHTSPPTNAPISINGGITLDFRNQSLRGAFGYQLNIDDGMITGGDPVARPVSFYFSPDRWHLRLGQQGQPLNATYYINPAYTAEGTAYFDTEGRFSDPSRLVERVLFGASARIYGNSGSRWVPLTRKDRVKVGGGFGFGFDGGAGLGLPYCGKGNTDDFFAYLAGNLSASAWVKYKESCDSWFFFFDEDKCGKWLRLGSFGLDLKGRVYTPSPTGLYVGAEIDLPFLDPFDLGFAIGDDCN